MPPRPSPQQQIRFCTTADGVNIAFALVGRGTVFVKTPNWLNHLELDVTSPIWRAWIERVGERHQLVRYDARGCGLSDRVEAPASFETNRLDLEAVVQAAGLTTFALFGASQGAAIAIEYAARHPERVTHLILYGAYLRGALKRDAPPHDVEEAGTLLKIVELGWGRENSAFRQVFANQFIPGGTLEQLRAFDELQRKTVSPEGAANLLASFYEIDVSALAAEVRCPTLVLHSRQDARVPFEEGRRVALAIADAEFVPLESRNHILLEQEPAWAQFFVEVDSFLLRQGGTPAEPPQNFADLTPAETRVLDRVAAGLSNDQIAASLGISPKTVRNHINHVFGKLGVSSRSQAIVRAREEGLGGASTQRSSRVR
ncbi:MAG: alpha/beta fold hydrolase [Caldimonas sp.]